jgi:hypothetical protein
MRSYLRRFEKPVLCFGRSVKMKEEECGEKQKSSGDVRGL